MTEHPMSLEEALQQEVLGKWSFYSAVTGQEWWGAGLGFGETHSFEVTEENRDKIYLAAKRMERLMALKE